MTVTAKQINYRYVYLKLCLYEAICIRLYIHKYIRTYEGYSIIR